MSYALELNDLIKVELNDLFKIAFVVLSGVWGFFFAPDLQHILELMLDHYERISQSIPSALVPLCRVTALNLFFMIIRMPDILGVAYSTFFVMEVIILGAWAAILAYQWLRSMLLSVHHTVKKSVEPTTHVSYQYSPCKMMQLLSIKLFGYILINHTYSDHTSQSRTTLDNMLQSVLPQRCETAEHRPNLHRGSSRGSISSSTTPFNFDHF